MAGIPYSVDALACVFSPAVGRSRWALPVYTLFAMVREGGFEPPHLAAPDPKSGASASSATLASLARIGLSNFSMVIKKLNVKK